jgi:hypothetical protein
MKKNLVRRFGMALLLSGTMAGGELILTTPPSHADGTCVSLYDVVSTPVTTVEVSTTLPSTPCPYPTQDSTQDDCFHQGPTAPGVVIDNVECVHVPVTLPPI